MLDPEVVHILHDTLSFEHHKGPEERDSVQEGIPSVALGLGFFQTKVYSSEQSPRISLQVLRRKCRFQCSKLICRLRPKVPMRARMARYLRIRHVVRTDRPSAHEQIQAICGIKPDGSHWSLTQDEAISQVEDGVSVFYVERPGGRRLDVIVAMDFHAHKYLKTVADGEQPDELLYLPNCLNLAHEIRGRSAGAGR